MPLRAHLLGRPYDITGCGKALVFRGQMPFRAAMAGQSMNSSADKSDLSNNL